MDSYIVTTENLCKKFGKHRAVNNISLKVKRNSIYGLLGPNGAGKSTTLKLITKLLHPTSGNIIFDGHSLCQNDLKNIGALIESPALYGNLTAEENLKVHIKLLNLTESRIREVLEIVDLKNTGKKRASQFSLGMKQRLGIAIALLNHPKLLILDEPTNGLDPLGIYELRDLIKSFPNDGITVILSSHILSEVEVVSNHIGIICNGMLQYQNEINKGDDLENLFMKVVKESRNGEETYNG